MNRLGWPDFGPFDSTAETLGMAVRYGTPEHTEELLAMSATFGAATRRDVQLIGNPYL